MHTIRALYLSPTILLHRRAATRLKLRAFTTQQGQSDVVKLHEKPSICTADELHYVSLRNCDWRLALWRYHPSPQAPKRNHPLLLLSGVGTNAIGYDLSPETSFARYMSNQGFDTWILEVRGTGLSVQGSSPEDIKLSANPLSDKMEAATSATNKQQSRSIFSALADSVMSAAKGDLTKLPTIWDESKLVTKSTETFLNLSERLSGFLSESQSKIISAKLLDQTSKLLEGSQLIKRFNEMRIKLLGLSETRQSSGILSQNRKLSQRLVDMVEEGQRSVSTPLFDLQTRFNLTIEDFHKQLELTLKYDWDFDHYLEKDVPAAMDYIREQSQSIDGKLLAVGHSMGGILLYALISRYGFEGRDPRLAAVGTLASSLNYMSSQSVLKLLLPLADPARALNVPVIPMGSMLAAAFPLSSSWLNEFISAEDMMHPELLEKLVLNSFCTIPAKLLFQLATAFREGGLSDRSGTFFYKDHIHDSNVPVLALAGDKDLICPPEAVEATVKLMPKHLVTYKVFGQSDGPHYAHYDLVGGRLAVEQVYPCIVEFLDRHDLS